MTKKSLSWQEITTIATPPIISSLVVGMLGGTLLGGTVHVLGQFLGQSIPLGIILIVVGATTILALCIGTEFFVRDYRNLRAMKVYHTSLGTYVGEGSQEIAAWHVRSVDGVHHVVDIKRSADRTRQFRWTTTDLRSRVPGPHLHLEVLELGTQMISEGYCVPELLNPDPTVGSATSARFSNLVKPRSLPQRVHHYLGKPPELTATTEERQLLPWPHVLLIEERLDGVFLFRYTAEQDYAGDTWHKSVEEARAQAAYEYEDLSPWQAVPPAVTDVVTFAVGQERQSYSSD